MYPEHEQAPCSLQLIIQEHEYANQESARRGRRTGNAVNNFIQKTFDILQEKKYESIVGWCESELRGGGCSFKIHNVKAFEEVVLPQYFKHSNMSSFVRQLNMYNFHKVRGDKNDFEFQHQRFVKNRPDLLPEIKRKQIESTASIPSIALIAYPDQELQHQKRDFEMLGLPSVCQVVEKPEKAQIKVQWANIFKKQQGNYAQNGQSDSPNKDQSAKKEKSLKKQYVQRGTSMHSDPLTQKQLTLIPRESILAQPEPSIQREPSMAIRSPEHGNELAKLAELQELNKSLRRTRFMKTNTFKQLILNNQPNMASKFNKLVMAIISSKLQYDLRPADDTNAETPKYSLDSLNEVVNHVMDTSPFKSFKEYMGMVHPFFDSGIADKDPIDPNQQ